MTIKTLVVDNNPVLLRVVSAFLEQEGCVVRNATNGLEALSDIKEERPDIIFTDLVMPLVGGEQLCKIVRNTPELQSIFLVVVSGIVLEDLENILSAEFYDLCIAKGNLKNLKEHIQEALERFRTNKNWAKKRGDKATTRIPEGLQKSNIAVELLSERRHLKQILDSLHEGIVELDRDGTVVSANQAALDILGVREEMIVGESYRTFPWPEYADDIRRWVKSRVEDEEETDLILGEENPIHFKDKVLTLTFIPVSKGETVFSVCILHDITRLYMAEEHERELNSAMELLRKMESLSSMAGGVAHDFNNLLTVICGNLDIVMNRKSNELQADQLKLIEYAHTAAYKAVDLARKISHSSPFGIVSHFETDLGDLVTHAVQSFNKENNAACTLRPFKEEIVVNADKLQMQTAITNVLKNSLEASGEGVVSVGISIRKYNKAAVISGQYVPEGSYACVTIADNGKGIVEEDLMKVFDPYYSTKQRGASKGMGLGLTVVYSTMRNHRGYVLVESEPGEGTQVRLLLPLRMEDQETVVADSQIDDDKRVLLVEYDVQARQICKTILEFIGWTVLTEEVPEKILEMINNADDAEAGICLMLISEQLCNTSQSHDFLKTINTVAPHVNLVVTGLSSNDLKEDFYREHGIENILTLPYTFEGIKKVIWDLDL